MDITILAIETSCDDTSCSIVVNGKKVLANIVSSQIDVHNLTGGVVPEIASRQHSDNIVYVIDETLKKANISLNDLDAIAVTTGPGLVGSLLVGVEAAKVLAYSLNIPLIGIHHIKGHIYANYLENDFSFPLLALVVSGGHTELIEMNDHYSFQKIMQTTDDAIGEAYDKVARVLELGYPGGPIIDKLAAGGTYLKDIKYNNNKLSEFSYSGLKSSIINYVNTMKMKKEEIVKEDVAYTFQEYAIEQIIYQVQKTLTNKQYKQLLLCGGVAANSKLREEVQKLPIEVLMPKISYCTDNAVMIAAYAYLKYLKKEFVSFSLKADPNLEM